MQQIPNTAVTVTIGDKEFTKTYTKVVFETVDDVLAALSKDEKGTLSSLNYGSDLKAKAAVRNLIITESAGPDKAIAKMVADIMKARAANGKPVTEEVAKKLAEGIMAAAA